MLGPFATLFEFNRFFERSMVKPHVGGTRSSNLSVRQGKILFPEMEIRILRGEARSPFVVGDTETK